MGKIAQNFGYAEGMRQIQTMRHSNVSAFFFVHPILQIHIGFYLI